jgi:hypothetical protein
MTPKIGNGDGGKKPSATVTQATLIAFIVTAVVSLVYEFAIGRHPDFNGVVAIALPTFLVAFAVLTFIRKRGRSR